MITVILDQGQQDFPQCPPDLDRKQQEVEQQETLPDAHTGQYDPAEED